MGLPVQKRFDPIRKQWTILADDYQCVFKDALKTFCFEELFIYIRERATNLLCLAFLGKLKISFDKFGFRMCLLLVVCC